ncbi:Nucleotide-sugar transporter [Phytophthora cactorum]|nr:Nucleotide-sugar transporter [Phytophthora cactorum]
MLVLQNTALSIVSKYSRAKAGPKYRPSSVVLLVEMLKFLLCYLMLLKTKRGNVKASVRTLQIEVFADKTGLTKMAVLAFLYALQNMFALVAYDYVDVATYQIVYQLKIITTAMFMIVLLHRRFSVVQWCAMPSAPTRDYRAIAAHRRSHEQQAIHRHLIMLGLSVNSGLAAAYFERVMKSHKGVQTQQTLDPLWTRNLQLSAISVGVTCFDLVRNLGEVWTNGFFYGFHPAVFAVIFLQAVGGLTIAAVVRYSDNITATFSFYFGVFLVVGSVFVYGDSRFAIKPVAAKKERRSTTDGLAHEIAIDTKNSQS